MYSMQYLLAGWPEIVKYRVQPDIHLEVLEVACDNEHIGCLAELLRVHFMMLREVFELYGYGSTR